MQPRRPQTEDATGREHNAIQGATDEARRMADAGLAVLSQCSPENEALLLEWFKVADAEALAHPTAVMRATRDGLSGDFTVQAEGSPWPWPAMRKEDPAYTYDVPNTDIHVVPLFFTLSPREQARALVHEAAHKWGCTDDIEYFAQARSSDLLPQQAAGNSDTYAWFAAEALAGAQAAAQRRDEFLERQAALAAWDALWPAVLADDSVLFTGWTTPDGTAIQAGTVQEVVLEHFFAEHAEDHAEFVEAYESGAINGPLRCRSGFVISAGLFDLLYEHAVATNP